MLRRGPDTEPPDGDWRIDDLAHRAHVPVDTIRFYVREGLLPPPRRAGRLTLYGPAHLLRLDQIRELQARQFSLGAIRALLEEDRLGLIESLFAAGEGSHTREELVDASGLDGSFVDRLEKVGLLGPPGAAGREGFDNGDLQVLAAIRDLVGAGIPEAAVLALARLYVEHFATMQREVLDVFSGRGGIDWPEADRAAFRARLPEAMGTILPLVDRLLNYVHRRTAQRMTLSAVLLAETPDE